MSEEEIMARLRAIEEQLGRIEARQLTVHEVIKEAVPEVGSFASTDHGQ